MAIPEIRHTGELQRILSLPRRAWSSSDLSSLALELTQILRKPGGTMALRPVQACALYEAAQMGGLFGPIGVGEGKTLITLLLAAVLDGERPLLLLPANLIEKTKRERALLSEHWRIPTSTRVFGYEMLGRAQSAEELEKHRPDIIICDEVHKLKNRRAAVTRRVARWMYNNPETKFIGLSGSIMDKSLLEFAHILRWALKLEAPVPTTHEECEEWAQALDERVDPMMRRKPGALLELCSQEEREKYLGYEASRHGFRRRLTETAGVVATIGEGESVGASIYVRGILHGASAVTEENFRKLRLEWRTPDEWDLMHAVDIWRHAQELALGLHYVWSPRPPDEWRAARSAWNSYVRNTIASSRKYDSELQVANAIDDESLKDPGGALARWREVRDTFKPNVIAIWHDNTALETCAKWAEKPGIIWTEHGLFARKLAELTGLPYFGAAGLDATGRYIEDADPKRACIASIDANREGKNLQKLWSRNLLVCPPTSAAWWEQTIARTHRPGQEADEVIVDVLLGCRENYDALQSALSGAKAIQSMTGKVQKLLLADVELPEERLLPPSERWAR